MSKNRPSTKEKEAATELTTQDLYQEFTDSFLVPEWLKKECEEAGLAYRWINATVLKQNYGFDRRNWKPYKPKGQPVESTSLSAFADTEGYYRRGDLIFAVMPQAAANVRKEILRSRTAQMTKAADNKTQARELRAQMKAANIKGDVSEGYDD